MAGPWPLPVTSALRGLIWALFALGPCWPVTSALGMGKGHMQGQRIWEILRLSLKSHALFCAQKGGPE